MYRQRLRAFIILCLLLVAACVLRLAHLQSAGHTDILREIENLRKRPPRLLPTVRGELLARLGRTSEAREEWELAVRLCGNDRERAVLHRKLDDLG